MGKIINIKNDNADAQSKVLKRIYEKYEQENLEEYKRRNKREEEIHKLNVRDRKLDSCIKAIKLLYKVVALIFIVCIGFNYLKDYHLHNIPIPLEAKIGLPIVSAYVNNIPKNIITLFKKFPP